jgi:hypothetical protein
VDVVGEVAGDHDRRRLDGHLRREVKPNPPNTGDGRRVSPLASLEPAIQRPGGDALDVCGPNAIDLFEQPRHAQTREAGNEDDRCEVHERHLQLDLIGEGLGRLSRPSRRRPTCSRR